MSETQYKDYVSLIDIQRNLESLQYDSFEGLDASNVSEFLDDIENDNDAIELHLLRTKSYKEMLVLPINTSADGDLRKAWMGDEQKTFSGSKIFYVNRQGSKILVVAPKDEMMNKLNMVVTRLNKVNQRIQTHNESVRKENVEVYQQKNSKKDDVIHFLNQNLQS